MLDIGHVFYAFFMDREVAQKKEKAKIQYRPYACSMTVLSYGRKNLWPLRTR